MLINVYNINSDIFDPIGTEYFLVYIQKFM